MITISNAPAAREMRAPHLYVDDAAQRHYRSLWQGVEGQARAGALALRLLGVTSSRRGEGSSTVAVHLALAAVRADAGRVLLVDADFARPSVQRVFGLPVEPGLADALRPGEANEAQVCATPLANLFVLTAGALGGKPSRAYDAMALHAAIEEFAADFDLVVFDMPPAGETSFALRLAGLLDAVLLVVEADRFSADVARRTAEILQRAHARLLGAVLNKLAGSASASPPLEV